MDHFNSGPTQEDKEFILNILFEGDKEEQELILDLLYGYRGPTDEDKEYILNLLDDRRNPSPISLQRTSSDDEGCGEGSLQRTSAAVKKQPKRSKTLKKTTSKSSLRRTSAAAPKKPETVKKQSDVLYDKLVESGINTKDARGALMGLAPDEIDNILKNPELLSQMGGPPPDDPPLNMSPPASMPRHSRNYPSSINRSPPAYPAMPPLDKFTPMIYNSAPAHWQQEGVYLPYGEVLRRGGHEVPSSVMRSNKLGLGFGL